MDYINITTSGDYTDIIESGVSGLFYFSHNSCNVGESVKDKTLQLMTSDFPGMKIFFIDVEQLSDLAGQNRIFTYPTILVFFEGKEFYRFSRNISILDMKDKIERPYNMIMG